MEIVDGDVAYLLGTDDDGAAAVGTRVGSDNSFSTDGARLFEILNNTNVRGYMEHNGDWAINMGDNGQQLTQGSVTESLTIMDTADGYSSIQILAGSQVKAVSWYVVTTLPGPATFSLGIAGDETRYANSVSALAGTSGNGMSAGIIYYLNNTSLVITPVSTPTAATGVIRITIHYEIVDAPTS